MARRLIATAVPAVLLLLLAPASVAGALVGSPPVTHPDKIKIKALSGDGFDLVANDTDPDGDELRVCRVSDVPRQLQVEVHDGQLSVFAPSKRTGTYTFTYYACDTSFLTAGTVTVKVGPPAPTIEVVPTKKPGKLRIINTFKGQTFHCQWQGLDDEKPDGEVTVRPQSSVVITVQEGDLVVNCDGAHSGYGFVFTNYPLD